MIAGSHLFGHTPLEVTLPSPVLRRCSLIPLISISFLAPLSFLFFLRRWMTSPLPTRTRSVSRHRSGSAHKQSACVEPPTQSGVARELWEVVLRDCLVAELRGLQRSSLARGVRPHTTVIHPSLLAIHESIKLSVCPHQAPAACIFKSQTAWVYF